MKPTQTVRPPSADSPTADPVDLHVGARIRLRRKSLGWSQERLAEGIALTFQQLQKYERAQNRVSASKLFAIAQALQVPVDYFFEGLSAYEVNETASENAVSAFLATPTGMRLAKTFVQLPASVQGHLLNLIVGIVVANKILGAGDIRDVHTTDQGVIDIYPDTVGAFLERF